MIKMIEIFLFFYCSNEQIDEKETIQESLVELELINK